MIDKVLTLNHISFEEWLAINKDLKKEEECDQCNGTGYCECDCCGHEEVCGECNGKRKVDNTWLLRNLYNEECAKAEKMWPKIGG